MEDNKKLTIISNSYLPSVYALKFLNSNLLYNQVGLFEINENILNDDSILNSDMVIFLISSKLDKNTINLFKRIYQNLKNTQRVYIYSFNKEEYSLKDFIVKQSIEIIYKNVENLEELKEDFFKEEELKFENNLDIGVEYKTGSISISNIGSVLNNIFHSASSSIGESITGNLKKVSKSLRKTDHIEFSIFVPKGIKPNDTFLLNIWAYLPKEYKQVENIIKTTSTVSQQNIAMSTGINIKRGSLLSLNLEINNLKVEKKVDTIEWNGQPTNALFSVSVPSHLEKKLYLGKITVHYQSMLITTIKFAINITQNSLSNYTNIPIETFIPQTAFASYSSNDREEVFQRLQGMNEILPNLDIFLDRLSLHSGDNWEKELHKNITNRDVFYLFWSKSASKSKWVEMEWKLALKERGLEYISPVPLDEPEYVPPPKALSALHFNDAYLPYIKYEQMKKKTP